MLPEELIYEILLRLPAKSLVKFKSVCKNWKSIITNPKFTKIQLAVSKKRYDLVSSHILSQHRSIMALHLDLSNQLSTNELGLVPMRSNMINLKMINLYFVGSCNGIICIHRRKTGELCLWNPTIDEARYISLPKNYLILFCGFGYVASIDDYKIVLAVAYKRSKSIIVYSVRRGNWRELDHEYYSLNIPQIYTQIYGGTNLYWWAIRSEPVVLDDALHWVIGNCEITESEIFILRFDMVNECFYKVFDLSKIIHNNNNTGTLLYLNQIEIGLMMMEDDETIGLCLYNVYDEYDKCEWDSPRKKRLVVEVLAMEEPSNWKIKYKYQGRWGNDNVFYSLQSVSGNGKVVVLKNRDMQNGKLEFQIIDLTKPKPYFILVNPNVIPRDAQAVGFTANYVSSLISPNSL